MIFKRVASVVSALAFASLPLYMLQPVTASAASITLTPVQTRALYGDTVYVYDGDILGLNTIAYNFNFYDYGTFANQYTRGSYLLNDDNTTTPFISPDIIGQYCVIYRSDATFTYDSSSDFTAFFTPGVSIGNIDSISFSVGFSNAETRGNTTCNMNRDDFKKSYVTMYSDDGANYIYKLPYTVNGSYYYMSNVGIKPDSQTFNFCASNCPINAVFYDNSTVNFNYRQSNRVQHPRMSDSSFNNYTYLYILCPTLTDTFIVNPDSGGGDDSGSDGGSCNCPDYSSDLQAILDYLDVIIGNTGLLSGTNSRLDNTNSKLDQVNSNLNKIDSHLDRIGADLSSLYYPGSGDTSRVNNYNSQFSAEWSQAHQDHQYLDSISRNADVSLPSLDNQYSMPDDFGQLWNYTDRDGFTWPNYILIGMPVLTLTVGILSYIIFGKAK